MFRRRGSRYRHRQHRRRIQRPMTDPEGWQRPMGGAVSGPERPKERQRSRAAWNARAQAITAAAAEAGLGACLLSHNGAARSEVPGETYARLGISVKEATSSKHGRDLEA